MEGLVTGPVDKNTNELSFCCPCLYQQAWDKAYNTEAGYENINPTPFHRKPKDLDHYGYELNDVSNGNGTQGSLKDLLKHWHRIYKTKHWNEYMNS